MKVITVFATALAVYSTAQAHEQFAPGDKLPEGVFRMSSGEIIDFRSTGGFLKGKPKPSGSHTAATPTSTAVPFGLNEDTLAGYIKFWAGTDTKQAEKFAKRHEAHQPFTMVNSGSEQLCIEGGLTNLETGVGKAFVIKERQRRLPLPPNTTVQMGNWILRGEPKFNGRVYAAAGCSEDCSKCPVDQFGAANTLVEWAYLNGNHDGEWKNEEFWVNLSNVDGLSSNVNMTVFHHNGKTCAKRSCHASLSQVKNLCPVENFWQKGSAFGCISQCHLNPTDENCCTGAFGDREKGNCQRSSVFLDQLCHDAYSWPYGDQGKVDVCKHSSGAMFVFSALN